MSDFAPADRLLETLEGGFSPQDNSAGSVNFGITEVWYRKVVDPTATSATIKSLTRDAARELRRVYWWPMWGRVADQKLAEALYVTAVNVGPKQATKLLQRTLNTIAAALVEDGALGPKTLAAIEIAHAHQSDDWVLDLFLDRVEWFYKDLAVQDPKQYADDLPGWLHRVKALR